MYLGYNLQGQTYYEADQKRRNLFDDGTFMTPVYPNLPAPPMEPLGRWPLSLAPGQMTQTILATEGYVRPGAHTFKAEGKGTIFANGYVPDGLAAAPGGFYPWPPVNGDDHYTFTLTKTERHLWRIHTTDPADPLRNLRLIPPGAVEGQDWHPDYLATLAGTRCIRGMDWLVSNDQSLAPGVAKYQKKTWADEDLRPWRGPAALVDLANTLHCDVWLCFPTFCVSALGGATDYAPNLGAFVAANLDPSLTCWLEYVDECWNWMMPTGTFQYITAQCTAYNATVPADRQLTRTPMQILLSHLCFEGFAQGAGGKVRTRRVLASQAANGGAGAALGSLATAGGWGFDAIASGPYVGPVWPAGTSLQVAQDAWAAGHHGPALDMVFAALNNGLTGIGALGQMPLWAAAADQYHVPHVLYECGIYLEGLASAAPDIAAAVVADPRIGQLTTSFLEQLGRYASMACWYQNAGQVAKRWGAMNDAGDVQSPRHLALQAFAKTWNL